MKKFFSDFKKFITRGNVVDMAIGVIIATAFTAIVTALANKIIMPLVNWFLLAVTGSNGLDAIYTYLHKVFVLDEFGNPTTTIDLANSIYIDWGAFITAIIDFLLIALILFMILKVAMASQGYVAKRKSEFPTKQERQQLKEKGITTKNIKVLINETKKLREENKVPEPAPKPTTDELLTEILAELKKQNNKKEKVDKKETTKEEAKKEIE